MKPPGKFSLSKHSSKLQKLDEKIVLTLITFFGFLTRAVPSFYQRLWFDESTTWYISKYSSLQDLISGNYFYDPHPPLHYILTKISILLLGESEIALRAPSIILGTLTIIYVYKLAKVICKNSVTALVAAALTAIWPPLVWYSAEARNYSSLIFLNTAAIYYLVVIIKNNYKLTNYIKYTFALSLSWLTNFNALYLTVLLYMIFTNYKINIARYLNSQKTKGIVLSTFVGLAVPALWIFQFFVVSKVGLSSVAYARWIGKPNITEAFRTLSEQIIFGWADSLYPGVFNVLQIVSVLLILLLIYLNIRFVKTRLIVKHKELYSLALLTIVAPPVFARLCLI